MHEDPTRRMDLPEPGMPGAGGYGEEPPRDGMSSGMKLLIGILVAAVLGLGFALLVVASDGDEDDPTTAPVTTEQETTSTPTEPTTTETQPTTNTAEPTTTETAPTTTEPTTTETQPTTTETTSTVTDLGTITEGSGGTESP